MTTMTDEPFWSPRRLASAWAIASAGAFALIGIQPIWSTAPLYADAAYRVMCLVSAIGTVWWMYRRGPGRPWLSDRRVDQIGRTIEIVSVVCSVAVLLVLAALLVLWWLT